MGRRDKRDDEEVKVHLTYFGGMYVDPGELLRSKAARETMMEMSRVLQQERRVREGEKGAGPAPQEQ